MKDEITLEQYNSTIEYVWNNHRYSVLGMSRDDYKQELYMTFLDCKRNFDKDKGDFKTYLINNLINKCFKLRKKANKKYGFEIPLTKELETKDDMYDTYSYDRILKIIDQIKNKKDKKIIKSFLKGDKKIDISKKFKISRPTLDKKIKKILEEIKNKF
jgi:RNA polymerase sigma factor (sigma-70 family)